MEKNVIVVDESGTEYGATYLKRARGLVKKGRARFVDEHTICLACPPNKILEDNGNMENDNINANAQTQESTLTVDYILARLEALSSDTDYIREALREISTVKSSDAFGAGSPGDIAGKAKAEAVRDTVKAREATNQQLIKLYEKMYDDIKPKQSVKMEFVGGLFGDLFFRLENSGCLNESTCEIIIDKIKDIANSF